ncbi:MAG: carbohydrate kinase [Terricaulis sp.]
MSDGSVLVLDVGKTNAKATLWTRAGDLIASRQHANATSSVGAKGRLDVAGVGALLAASLTEMAKLGPIDMIVPVAHGAAAAFLCDGALAAAPVCYESAPAPDVAAAYNAMRDPFAATGSPRLPDGLNLGVQLYELEEGAPELKRPNVEIVPYAQYWSWRLCGVAASEVSALGCHTDLWRPYDRRFSDLARQRGWDRRFAPLRRAADVLGVVRNEWVARTGVNADCRVLCGGHDSNVAFYGVRSNPELAGRDVTVISTGTWFVAMRAPMPGFQLNSGDLNPDRDVLINVTVEGEPAPSARFMGGREVERLIGGEDNPLRDPDFVHDVVPQSVAAVLNKGAMILPSFAPGVGPFAARRGGWEGPELSGVERRAAVGLYLALMTEAALALIGARDAIVVEGRFAADTTFLRALAALRPDCEIYAAEADDGLSSGALRLARPEFQSRRALSKIAPLRHALGAYAERWRRFAAETGAAA